MSEPMLPSDGLTDQQRLAVFQRSVSVVLSSGAGCGKTHVLTARYLSHLKLDQSSVPQIVAITFTERAAREMRGRIRQGIHRELQSLEGDSLTTWEGHLNQLETAPINTIHGFCGELLRQNAISLGLDPGFEILDASFADNLRKESNREVLKELLIADVPERDDLHELIILFGWNSVQRSLESLLLEADPAAWQAWATRDPAQVADEWGGSKLRELLPIWVEHLLNASPKIVACLSLLRRSRRPTTPGMAASVDRILTDTPRLASVPNLTETIAELCQCAKVQGTGGKKAWGDDDDLYEQVKEAFAGYRKELEEQFAIFTEEAGELEEAVRVGQRFLRVALHLTSRFAQRKRERGVVDFQDLLVRARDLIRDHPSVRESLQKRFRFLLLDELQDTDPVQMEIVSLLCGEVGVRHGKLFAVGDHKQSIYRFRGADVALFEALRQSTPEDGRLGLTRNFRSQPGVLDFVNALCSLRMPRYEPLIPHHPRVHESACVEFLWSRTDEDKSADALRWADARGIARRIRDLLDGGERKVFDAATGELRPVQPGDVILLFRAMTEVATYEAALREQELDYYLVGGRAFFAQQEVHDLLNLLRTLENPEDSLSLAGTLRSPFCSLSDEALFLLGTSRLGLWRALHQESLVSELPEDQRAPARRAVGMLDRWARLKDRSPISGLMAEILRDSGYDAALQFEFLGERKLANLWKLQEIARQYDESSRFTLADFIARLGEMVRDQPREEQAATQPENANVVKLMSIHQSKGLEFPVVFVPDFARRDVGDRHATARWHAQLGCLVNPPEEGSTRLFPDLGWKLGRCLDQIANWQEDLRVLYVACTRARDLLILSAGSSDPVPPAHANAWTLALGERFDLSTGECLDTEIDPTRLPRVRVIQNPPADPPKPLRPQAEDAVRPLPKWEPLRVPPALPKLVSLFAVEPRVPSTTAGDWDLAAQDRFPTPRERLHLRHGLRMSRRESLFRRVLEQWDFRDPEEWKDLLTRLLDERFEPFEASQEMNVLGELFATLAESPVRTELLQACSLFREIEFRIDGPRTVEAESVMMPFSGPAPHLEGVIDFVWQSRSGDWHLLGIDRGGSEFFDESWLGRRPILSVQAYALQQQLGNQLKTVRHFDLYANRVEKAEAKTLKFSPALRWVFGEVGNRFRA